MSTTVGPTGGATGQKTSVDDGLLAQVRATGHNPNAAWARSLQDSLEAFRLELRRHPQSADLTLAFERANEVELDLFFSNLNRRQSLVNKEAIDKIANVFSLLSAANQSACATTENLDQLFGVVQCSFMAGYSLGERTRDAAGKLEVMGLWTKELAESELEVLPAWIAWDRLAMFSYEVVRFCTELLRCRRPDEMRLLVTPEEKLEKISKDFKEEAKKEIAKREQSSIGKQKEDELRKKAREEAAKKHEEEIRSMQEWLENLAPANKTHRHSTLSASRQSGTCNWFVTEVLSSINQGSKVVWAEGKPGVGKSVLISAVIDHVNELLKKVEDAALLKKNEDAAGKTESSENSSAGDSNSVITFRTIAYVYFAFDERVYQEPLAVYAQLLRQLYPKVTMLDEPLHKVRSECSQPDNKPSASQLLEILQKLPKTVLLVFDALDEAIPEVRDQLCKWIHDIHELSPGVLVSTRRDVQMPDAPRQLIHYIGIEASKDDMEIFIRAKIEANESVQRIVRKTMGDEAKKWTTVRVGEILDNAQRMFLLVIFRIQDFCAQKNVRGMERASQKRDTNPDAIYTRTLLQIRKLPQDQIDLAYKVIGWLTFAKTSMDTNELTEALAIQHGVYSIDPKEKVFAEDMEEICRGLVVLDTHSFSPRLRLAHQTVQEHFSSLPEFQYFKEDICRACFTYLTYVSLPGKHSRAIELHANDDDDEGDEALDEDTNDDVDDDDDDDDGGDDDGEESFDNEIPRDEEEVEADDGDLSSDDNDMEKERPSKRGPDLLNDPETEEAEESVPESLRDEDEDEDGDEEGEEGDGSSTEGHYQTGRDVDLFSNLENEGNEENNPITATNSSNSHARRSSRVIWDEQHELSRRPPTEAVLTPQQTHDSSADSELSFEDISDDDDYVYTDLPVHSRWPKSLSQWVEHSHHALSSYAGRFALAHLQETISSSTQQGVDPTTENLVLKFIMTMFARRRRSTFGSQPKSSAMRPYGMKMIHLAVFVGICGALDSVLPHPDVEVNSVDKFGRSPLAWALYFGQLSIARRLLDNDADVNLKDSVGDAVICYASKITDETILQELVAKTSPENLTEKALKFAISDNNPALVKMLLAQKVSPNYGESGKSRAALHEAAILRHETIIPHLLKAGAETSAKDGDGETPLAICCRIHLLDSSDLLLRSKADPRTADNDLETPLHHAAGSAIGLVKGLLRAGADPLAQDRLGRTPLIWFLHRQRDLAKPEALSVVKLLCPNAETALCRAKDGSSALHLGAKWHDAAIVKHMLKLTNGGGLGELDSLGRSPLFLAFERGERKLINSMLDFEPSGLEKQVYRGLSVLDEVIAHGDTLVVQRLLQLCPALVSKAAFIDRTPLFTAAYHDRLELFRLMLTNDVDINFRRSDGSVVFHEVCQLGREEMARSLIDRRAWICANSEGAQVPVRNFRNDTVLHSAAESAAVGLMQDLLKLEGLDARLTNHAGDTPLHICARGGSPDMIKPLLEYGTDINLLNNAGKTALDFALERGDGSTIQQLIVHAALPGLLWPTDAVEVTKWAQESWSSDLEYAIQLQQGQTLSNRFSADVDWKSHRAQSRRYARFSEDSSDIPYLEVLVPDCGSSSIRRIVFKTHSHDQGFSWESEQYGNTYESSWTWFEAGVFRELKDPNTKPLSLPRRTVHCNVHASYDYHFNVNIWDYRDTDSGLRAWLGSIKGGDVIQVYPKALFPAWENHVKGVEVEILYENSQQSMTSSRQMSIIPANNLNAAPQAQFPRVVCYFQTLHTKDGDPISLRPLVDEQTGVTHVIVAAVHLNSEPEAMTLNDDLPESTKYEVLWNEMAYLQRSGIKILAMLGGAAKGSFTRLDGSKDTFVAFYRPLEAFLRCKGFDGVDLDVEEQMSLYGVTRLIDQLRLDFGPDFLITLAPVATALHDSLHLSGFDYELLELRRGHQISWYNTQFYCGWCGPSLELSYQEIMHRGWPLHKVVMGLSTNPETGGYISMDQLDNVLAQISAYPEVSASFGGIMGWEYFNALPGGLDKPWEWAKQVSELIAKYFKRPATPVSTVSGHTAAEQVVSVELKGSEMAKIAETSQDNVAVVQMKVTDNTAISEAMQGSDEVVSIDMKVTDIANSVASRQ